MLYLNEWLPNPNGSDASGEFVEFYNDGRGPVGLSGFRLVINGKKSVLLTGRDVPPRGYLVLSRREIKIAFPNTDGALALYDAGGRYVDGGEFHGPAPSGKSFSRADRGTGPGTHFAFVAPTPGAENKILKSEVAHADYPADVPLNHGLNAFDFFAMMMGTSTVLAGLLIYTAYTNEDLSELFFK